MIKYSIIDLSSFRSYRYAPLDENDYYYMKFPLQNSIYLSSSYARSRLTHFVDFAMSSPTTLQPEPFEPFSEGEGPAQQIESAEGPLFPWQTFTSDKPVFETAPKFKYYFVIFMELAKNVFLSGGVTFHGNIGILNAGGPLGSDATNFDLNLPHNSRQNSVRISLQDLATTNTPEW